MLGLFCQLYWRHINQTITRNYIILQSFDCFGGSNKEMGEVLMKINTAINYSTVLTELHKKNPNAHFAGVFLLGIHTLVLITMQMVQRGMRWRWERIRWSLSRRRSRAVRVQGAAWEWSSSSSSSSAFPWFSWSFWWPLSSGSSPAAVRIHIFYFNSQHRLNQLKNMSSSVLTRKTLQLKIKFSPTWSCVSLPRSTTSSGWKLLIID